MTVHNDDGGFKFTLLFVIVLIVFFGTAFH